MPTTDPTLLILSFAKAAALSAPALTLNKNKNHPVLLGAVTLTQPLNANILPNRMTNLLNKATANQNPNPDAVAMAFFNLHQRVVIQPRKPFLLTICLGSMLL